VQHSLKKRKKLIKILHLVFGFLKKYLKVKAEKYPLNGAMMDV